MLRAYFDASERKNGTFCVAGYAFTKPQLKRFDKAWWKIFGKYGGCHMSELAQAPHSGRFKGVSSKDAGKLLERGVRVIKDEFSFGVVVSCQLQEINELLPAWIDGFQHAYPVCCHVAMTALGMKLTESGINDEVAYFFESGDEFSGAAHRFMQRTDDTSELKVSYRHGSHTFLPKEKALAFEAADVLAWEWTKYIDETVSQRKRLMRRSLAELMGRGGDFDRRYAGLILTGNSLRNYCERVNRLGLLQMSEELFTGKISAPQKKGVRK